jgi:hypothetical protein
MSSNRTLAFAITLALASGSAVAGKADTPAAGRAFGLIDEPRQHAPPQCVRPFSVKDVVSTPTAPNTSVSNARIRGLPVIGGDFVVHSRNGAFKSASQTLKTAQRRISTRAFPATPPRSPRAPISAPASMACARAEGRLCPQHHARLAYEVVFTGTKKDQTPTEMHYFIDAPTAASSTSGTWCIPRSRVAAVPAAARLRSAPAARCCTATSR